MIKKKAPFEKSIWRNFMKSFNAKRLLALSVAVLMLLSFAACGGSGEKNTGETSAAASGTSAGTSQSTSEPLDIWAKYEPEIEVSTVLSLPDALTTNPKVPKEFTPESNPYTEVYKKDLGINLKVNWAVAQNQYDQKLNIAISANDLPDITFVNNVQFKKLVDSGMTEDMTEVYDQYISDWARPFLEGDGGLGLQMSSSKGKLMGIPLLPGVYDGAPILWIRNDWLKKLNLQAPKTLDEMYKIADAFTNQDPDGNKQKDTVGIGLVKDLFNKGIACLEGYFDSFGAYPNTAMWLKDSSGNLVAGTIQPEVKTALAKLADMYKAGQINQEFAVQDSVKLSEQIASGKVGMYFGQHWTALRAVSETRKSNPESDWRPFPIPSGDGSPAKPAITATVGNYYVIKKGAKNPEAAIKMLNLYLKYSTYYSPDYDPLLKQGSRSKDNPKVHDPEVAFPVTAYAAITGASPTQNIDIYRDYQTLAKTGDRMQTKTLKQDFTDEQVQKQFLRRIQVINEKGMIPDSVEETVTFTNTAGKQETAKLFEQSTYGGFLWTNAPFSAYSVIAGYVDNNQLLSSEFYGPPTNTMTSKNATLIKMQLETFTKIIMGEDPVDAFDKYVDDWKKLGGDDITREVNEWYKNK